MKEINWKLNLKRVKYVLICGFAETHFANFYSGDLVGQEEGEIFCN